MCEFCTKHGDGKIWYKNAGNYAQDLMSDIRRRQYVKDFLESTIGEGITTLGRLETIYRKKRQLPARVVKAMVAKAREEHFGQVVPIEDIKTIVEKAATVVRIPCACRWAAEKKEKRCCYSVSYSAETWYKDLDMKYFGKVPDEGFETVSPEVAVAQMEQLEEEGAIHTIWTMMTPFVGAICNCTNQDCLGLRTLAMDVETLFPGEYVAAVDQDLCDGCGLCAESCQFNAISSRQMAGGETVAVIDAVKCHGCGLCRIHCPQEALALFGQ
ncbi:ATP-binding protein [Thermodesulfobacteriota bacterium]